MAETKMASISEKFSGECFDLDFHRLSASSPRGLVLKPKQKEAVSYLLNSIQFSIQ